MRQNNVKNHWVLKLVRFEDKEFKVVGTGWAMNEANRSVLQLTMIEVDESGKTRLGTPFVYAFVQDVEVV